RAVIAGRAPAAVTSGVLVGRGRDRVGGGDDLLDHRGGAGGSHGQPVDELGLGAGDRVGRGGAGGGGGGGRPVAHPLREHLGGVGADRPARRGELGVDLEAADRGAR